jgi:hypothetical protein
MSGLRKEARDSRSRNMSRGSRNNNISGLRKGTRNRRNRNKILVVVNRFSQ